MAAPQRKAQPVPIRRVLMVVEMPVAESDNGCTATADCLEAYVAAIRNSGGFMDPKGELKLDGDRKIMWDASVYNGT